MKKWNTVRSSWIRLVYSFLLGICLTLTSPVDNIHAQNNDEAKTEGYTALLNQQMVFRGVTTENNLLSLNFNNIGLADALNTLAREVQVGLAFNAGLTLNKKVTIQLERVTVYEALERILSGTGLEAKIPDSRDIIFIKKKEADIQLETVTGTVTSADNGEPLPGVNVVVKGTTTGTSTDQDGEYRLNVPSLQDTLVFSFIGYQTQQVPINGRTTINVTLSLQTVSGDELVVVGYSEKRQSELSSSVTVVDEQELEGVATDNLNTMLQGKVAGLMVSNVSGHPQRSPQVVIRGAGSIGAGNDPLYVVDGIIGGSFNPQDIASITVLKDAAATGLYGSRAANGVILVTTKRGKRGETQVSYNSSVGFTYHRNGNIEMMNSEELYNNRRQAAKNYYDDQVENGNPEFTGQKFEQYLGGVIPSSVLNTNSYWPDLLTRRGFSNRHQLSVSGGNEKTTFYISGNYFSELGTLVNEDYTNFNLRGNLDHQISDKFSLTWKLNGSTTEYKNDPGGGQSSVTAQYYVNMPWDPVYEEDGVTPFKPFDSGFWYANNGTNYFYDREHYSDRTKELDLDTDLTLEADITDWLILSTSNRVGLGGRDWKQVLDKYHPNADFENGRISQTYSYSNSFTTSNLARLNHSFGDHNLSGILGQEYSYTTRPTTNGVGVDIPVGITALGATGKPKAVGGVDTETGFLSYFGQVDYNYQGRYYLVGSLRRDASSRFGANNKWATFYSIGSSWMINREEFLKNSSWLDVLKLKFSYGATGNADIPDYLSLATYSFSTRNTYNANSGARPSRLENPDLTWELAYTTNVGLEVAAFERFNLSLDFYYRKNKDLLQSVPLPATSGFGSQQRNVGSVSNRGIDVSLSTVNIEGNNFQWESNFNMNINKNKVLALNNGNDIPDGSMRLREGLPLRYFYMRKWSGVDVQTGKPTWIRWEDENGNIIHGGDRKEPANIVKTSDYNKASNLFIESSYPDVIGGIRNDVFYKNFSLSVLLNYVVGQTVYNQQRRFMDDDGAVLSKNQMKMQDDWVRWEEPGDVATHPELMLGGNSNSFEPSSRYLEDGSYLRIQNVSLSYTFPNIFEGVISGLKLYAKVDNLAVLTKYSGATPDVNFESPVFGQGGLSPSYAAPRRVLFGINLDF